ncbi:PDDEXK family nuclease [Nocardia seriolae]|uniref:hypothetical protein n=1 Tax=Nocardia seriolae TaxID=37332 RepID=UPI000B0C3759|nr:hypothetical protein [Nocardia seriolae]QOW30527.1 hypothetical protein IMZ23_20125 [Nocardia seriolae]QUN15550.1 hypothetical protein KEC46_24775 [Nocardia seriolae]WNJ57441.1 hypothetical protein RMO66_29050 [Nocardia seriolae]
MTADAGTSVHTAEPEQAAGDGRQWAARRSRRAPGEGCGAKRGGGRESAGASAFGRRESHRRMIRAVVPEMAAGTVVSHQSAAVLYNTTLWRAPLERVCVTRNRRGGGRVREFAKVHGSPVDSAVEIGGLLVTTPARTVVDLALTLPFEAAVVAGDALVGSFGLGPAELAEELGRAKGRYGINQAKQVLTMLDGRSQSIGESLSRIMIHRGALPRSQGNVFTPDGRFVGRVDFYYESAGVICEFDGPTEYGRLLRPGQDLATLVHRERTRETYLRTLGFEVIRWTWDDLVRGTPAQHLRNALSTRRRPDGRIEPAPAPEPRSLAIRAL